MKTTTRIALFLAIGATAASCKVLLRQVVPHIERWGNGLTKREGRLEGGLQTGDWTYFFESGQRRAHGRYENDHQVGPWTYWFETGGIEWSGAFDPNGKRTGDWTFYHADGSMRARGRYVEDFEEGGWEFFGADGAAERVGQYDAGKMSGPWQHFYAGGRPKAAGLCHRGQRIGPWQVWDEAGKEGAQDFGLRAGVEIALEKWPNGTRRRTGVLQNGAAVGRWTSFHENGALRFCCTLRDGAATGVFEARNAAGQVIAAGLMKDGQFVDGVFAVVGATARPIPPGQVPALPEPVALWAADQALAAMPPEATVALLCAEARAPVDAAARPAAVAVAAAATPPPAVAAVVEQIAQEPERVPPSAQPSLTVVQEKEIEDYVANYRDGTSPSRPSLRSYTPTGPAQKQTGPRRRSDLEGKPLPIDMLRGVDGTDVDLRQYRGKKRVLLVVLRGFLGEVCVYCVAQTEALAQCRAELEALDIEVLVLYPGARENEDSFEKAYAMTFGKGAPPYKVFYDPDLEVVQKLGITGDLAYPTTLIVDQQGVVQYAYVGAHRADRPAAKELIRIIKGMKQ